MADYLAGEDARWQRAVIDGKLYALDRCDSGVVNLLEIESVVAQIETPRHRVEIARYVNFGLGLRMDGSQQTCETDSDKYAQAFVHPAMIFDRRPFRCVGLYGAGDFELLRELRRYGNIARMKVVDWDPDFMEIAKIYLPTIHRDACEDPRVRIETEFPDAFAYMERGREKFHYLFVDLTDNAVSDLLKPGMGRKLKLRLIPNGKVILQAGEFSDAPEVLEKLLQGLAAIRNNFRYFWLWRRYVPFFRYEQGIILATDDEEYDPIYPSAYAINDLLEERLGYRLAEYNGSMHHSFFSLPRTIAKAVHALLGPQFRQYYGIG